jgi:hypothetical protein
MKVLNTFFRCLVIENLVVYAVFVIVMLSFSVSRGVGNYLGAIAGVSMLITLLLSITLLFIDRRLALRGFLVVFVGFVIAMLFPQL